MGMVHESITLKNAVDVGDVRRGYIKEPDIRQIKVRAMVDTGAETLVISEAIRQALGLDVLGAKRVSFANESVQTCHFTEPVEVHWNDRFTSVHALVIPDIKEVLLGAISLEGLNVIVDPLNQQLIGAHGDEMIFRI